MRDLGEEHIAVNELLHDVNKNSQYDNQPADAAGHWNQQYWDLAASQVKQRLNAREIILRIKNIFM